MWRTYTKVVFIFVLASSSVCASCPNSWIRHESSCYHFSHDLEQWADAMTICKILGGFLVEINSDIENNFIKNNLRASYSYIGATDLLDEGVWQWMTSLSKLEYSAWQTGEPNNVAVNENCALVYKSVTHGWNDVPCKMEYTYVCEQEASSEVVIG